MAGTLAYHYFEGDKDAGRLPLWRVIYQDRGIASRILCLSEEQIKTSVRNASPNARPHYGDGAYCTLHARLDRAHRTVVIAHGIDPRITNYRVVFTIEAASSFNKFRRTAGVVRSLPQETCLYSGKLVRIGEETGLIRFLRVEHFSGEGWKPVPRP